MGSPLMLSLSSSSAISIAKTKREREKVRRRARKENGRWGVVHLETIFTGRLKNRGKN